MNLNNQVTKLYKFIQDMAENDSASSKAWLAAGSESNSHYRAGASNACLAILDFIERHTDYNEEVKDDATLVMNAIRNRKAAEICDLIADTELSAETIHANIVRLVQIGSVRVISNGRRNIYASNE